MMNLFPSHALRWAFCINVWSRIGTGSGDSAIPLKRLSSKSLRFRLELLFYRFQTGKIKSRNPLALHTKSTAVWYL